ncbi:MAG: uracil-DNA glycosylase [Desulfurococcales archaeon]|nr:uracil-DNA glycosylase [Desulfurococcales archaeon]
MSNDCSQKLSAIAEKIAACKRCPLHASRTNPVPGEGDCSNGIMLIGEAPGRNEDLEGRPFVGRAGMLLEELLKSIGLEREDVFITNVVKCRPPRNRDPRPDEISTCLPFLVEQIRVIKPGLIITLGRISGSTIFRLAGLRWTSMHSIHGKMFERVVAGVKTRIIPTFHPASAFYRVETRRLLEKDFEGSIRRAVDLVLGRKRGLLDFF